MLVLFVLTPFSVSSTVTWFFAFRVAQTRLMLLMVVHGLKPNQKLKAILERYANLSFLWGADLKCHALFMRDFLQPKFGLQPVRAHRQHATQILHILHRVCQQTRFGP